MIIGLSFKCFSTFTFTIHSFIFLLFFLFFNSLLFASCKSKLISAGSIYKTHSILNLSFNFNELTLTLILTVTVTVTITLSLTLTVTLIDLSKERRAGHLLVVWCCVV